MTKSLHRCTVKIAHWTAEESEGEVRSRRHRAPVHRHDRAEWRERDAGQRCRQCRDFRAGAGLQKRQQWGSTQRKYVNTQMRVYSETVYP